MVEIELATTDDAVDRALAVAESVWGAAPVSVPIARAQTFAGWYAAIAHDDGRAVGMCAGFVGVHEGGWHLHSHLAAVVPDAQGRGVGRALKSHQRSWCLDHGIEVVTWTFDPLVAENGRFNLHHLGAIGDRYLVDLYGEMDDEINRGQPSDRLLMRWDLLSDQATNALSGPLPTAHGDVLRADGAIDAVIVLDGEPTVRSTDADVRLVATPDAIGELRRTDPVRALRWRHAVRDAMISAFAAGLRPVAMTDDGSYLCLRPTPPETVRPGTGTAR